MDKKLLVKEDLSELKELLLGRNRAKEKHPIGAKLYNDPRVLVGNWYENFVAHKLIQADVPMSTTYQESYKVQDMRSEDKRKELWTQEPHEAYNESRSSYFNRLQIEGINMPSYIAQGFPGEFDNNYSTMYSLYHRNAKEMMVPELLVYPRISPLDNFGNTADHGLKEILKAKWENYNSRESLYPVAISTSNDTYRWPIDVQYTERKATPKALSCSFFKVYTDNQSFQTRDLPVRLLPDVPDTLKRVDPDRKLHNIIPFI